MTASDDMTDSGSHMERRTPWYIYSILALVLLIGLALRVWNVNFDQGIGSHPDERSTACFYATSIRLPSSLQEFRDPHQSPLNPLWDINQQTRRSFTYGHFPLYLGIATGEVMHTLAPLAERIRMSIAAVDLMARAHQDCDAIAVAGRLTIALLDTLTILFLFLMGMSLFGPVAGLLAATFYAFGAQAIQLSHFFAMDPASTTFIVLAVYGGVRTMKKAGYGSALLTGLAAGLAISSKFSSLPVLAVPITAGLLVIIVENQRAHRECEASGGRLQFRATVGVIIALAIAAIAFAVTSPYAILDWQNFIQATLIEQGRMVRGIADMPFTRQYRNTIPYIYFLQQQIEWGLWWPLGIVALISTIAMFVGMLYTVAQLARNWILSGTKRADHIRLPANYLLGLLIVWSWVIPYFAITGAFLAKFNRYMSPLLPFAALFSAAMLWVLWHSGERSETPNTYEDELDDQASGRTAKRISWRKVLAASIALLAVTGSLFWSAAYVNGVYRGEHNWITASRWIYENVPEGSVILWELWDDPLPKSIPGEPGMDMGSHGLRNIDWSPYEEDTAQKYEILKSKLREADFVAYSSKRIYDSVDELPQRYPMTTRYYDAMRDGRLGYEVALELTSPPSLFGFTFEDRTADESWSLYDHPQVTVLRKVRDLSDAEFDEVLGGTWTTANAYDTGDLSWSNRLLLLIGLRGEPGSEYEGVFGGMLRFAGGEDSPIPAANDEPALMLNTPLAELAIVDNYRWNVWASERSAASAVVWWLTLTLLGWAVWPMCFQLCASFRDRGYFLSRTAGWLLAGWGLWYLASTGVVVNSVRNAWIIAAALVLLGAIIAYRTWDDLGDYLRKHWLLLLVGEMLVAAAFVLAILIRMSNPDLWQPWFGGEKFMEFAFLNGILRSPSFPPVNPHFAGGFINYYYFGIYLASYLIKLTGIYSEVGFNLTIAMLFALTVSNSFSIAYTAWGKATYARTWRSGFFAALLAPLFITVVGNLDGFAQIVRNLSARGGVGSQAGLLSIVPDSILAVGAAITGQISLPAYDFWAPSRVIPYTINEFPYWSFLFADLHPHVIGIPLALLFCGLLLAVLGSKDRSRRYWISAIVTMAFLLGALSSVNLWELPTYLALGVLTLAVIQFRQEGRVRIGRLITATLVYVVLAYLFFLPFFRYYVNVGASGVGLVRSPDSMRTWLLIWGLFIFVVASWLVYATVRRPRQCGWSTTPCMPTGDERVNSLMVREYDRLPRMIYLHRLLVKQPTFGYLVGLALIPISIAAAVVLLIAGQAVLGLCVLLLAPTWMLLWKRGSDSDPAALLIALLSFASLALLAGTQVIFLRDFLQGGDWYRMNTLFKFFMQVWVLLGLAAAIAVPRLWRYFFPRRSAVAYRVEIQETNDGLHASEFIDNETIVTDVEEIEEPPGDAAGFAGHSDSQSWPRRILAVSWAVVLVVLILASLAFPVFGTPARLSQRMNGWRPEFGTLNGMEYMREASYTWPDDTNSIQLKYDWEAIRWLLDNVRGNPVIVESSEVDYYRAGSSRIASFTGISGLRGMHESEQRPGEALSAREQDHREFWTNPDAFRTQEIMDQLGISLVYVGQLERYLHPDGVSKLEMMAEDGALFPIFENEGVTIYGVRGRLVEQEDGVYAPAAAEPASAG